MTSPFVIREQSFAEEIAPGVQTLMQALQLRQQEQQFQATLQQRAQDQELERLRLAQQQRNAQTNQVLSFMQQLGPEILDDPSLAQHLEQAGLNPKTILKTFQEQQKQQQLVAKQEMDAFISTLPEDLQPGYQAAIKAMGVGFGKEAAGDLAAALTATRLTPEQVARLDAEFPEFKDLPTPEKVKAIVGIKELQVQVRTGVGPEVRRQAQTRMDALRAELARVRIQMAQAKDPSDKSRLILAYLSLINQEISDPLNVGFVNPDLIGQPRRAIIEGLFGAPALKAYDDALNFLQTQIPAGEQPQEQP